MELDNNNDDDDDITTIESSLEKIMISHDTKPINDYINELIRSTQMCNCLFIKEEYALVNETTCSHDMNQGDKIIHDIIKYNYYLNTVNNDHELNYYNIMN